MFYNKWEKIIKSGMEEDLTRLNPMAHWMMAKDDIGLLTVQRLKRELGSISNQLPQPSSHKPSTARPKSTRPNLVAQAVNSQHKLLTDMKFLISKPICI